MAETGLMRALVLRDFGDVVLTEVPKPVPRSGEVRVQRVAGHSCQRTGCISTDGGR
jgi:hypothetical protein